MSCVMHWCYLFVFSCVVLVVVYYYYYDDDDTRVPLCHNWFLAVVAALTTTFAFIMLILFG